MGANISKVYNHLPIILKDFFVDGSIDVTKYSVYRKIIDRRDENALNMLSILEKKQKRNDNYSNYKRQKRSVKKNFLLMRDDTGSLRVITPYETLWYLMYVKEDP